MGNGASIKTGARAATGKYLVFMDAGGQYKSEDISKLLEKYVTGMKRILAHILLLRSPERAWRKS